MDDKPKRRPGRPKKAVLRDSAPREGIVYSASNADDPDPNNHFQMELVYNNPLSLKKILALIGSYNITMVTILFDRTSVWILGVKEDSADIHNKPSISFLVEIKCENAQKYYVETPFRISLVISDLNKTLTDLNKDCNSLYLYSVSRSAESCIYGRYVSPNGMIDSFEFTLNTTRDTVEEIREKIERLIEISELDALQFSFNAKSFKNKINSYAKLRSKEVVISGQPELGVITSLSLDSQTEDSKITKNSTNIPCEPYKTDDRITVIAQTEHMKALANALISENLEFGIRNDLPIRVRSKVDQEDKMPGTEKCVVDIFVRRFVSEFNPNEYG